MAKKANILLINSKIYIANNNSWAEAMAISKNKIAFIGTNLEAQAWIGKKTKVINLEQKLVLPSFIDSHVHPIWAGMSLSECDLFEKKTKAQILTTIKEYIKSHSREKWITGTGWNLSMFTHGNPKKEWLDEICPHKPIFLFSNDYHSAWVNSKALALAGITQNTADPPHGQIERNLKNEPSGTLRESAIELVKQRIPAANLNKKLRGLKKALTIMNSLGITGFQDAYCDAQVYHEAEKRGFLTARVTGAMITAPEKTLSEQISAFQKTRKQFSGQYFKPSALKIFLDGVMETDTASLFEPYCSHHHDALIWDPKKLQKLMQTADQKQFQLHFHAIGDRAVHAALDVIQELEHQKPRDRRSLIAHLQLIHPDDMKRFGQLPVVPIFQAFWAQRDKDMLATLPKLGPKRARWLYPIKSVMDSGAILALGSDWHVSTVNPLEAIQVAITRQPLGKKTQKALNPEECITLLQALKAYTFGSAYANFWEHKTGTLEVGKSADLVVLSDNLFEIPVSKISKARVLMTFFEGKEVFRA